MKNKLIKIGLPLLLLLLLVGGFIYYSNYRVYSVITIDVNPSFELRISSKDKVLKVVALNDDAEKVVKEIKLDDKNVDKVVEQLSLKLKEKGYLSDDDDKGIFLTVKSKDEKKVKELRKTVNSTLRKNVNEKHKIYNQGINNEDINEIKDESKKNEINLGKALFIKRLLKLDKNLKFEDLAKMEMNELVKLAKTYKDKFDKLDDDDDDYYEDLFDDLFDDLDELDDDDDDKKKQTQTQKQNNKNDDDDDDDDDE